MVKENKSNMHEPDEWGLTPLLWNKINKQFGQPTVSKIEIEGMPDVYEIKFTNGESYRTKDYNSEDIIPVTVDGVNFWVPKALSETLYLQRQKQK